MRCRWTAIRCCWWTPIRKARLFGSWIELGETFFDAPVPVDLRALYALKKSPLALDLYAWSTYRTFRVNRDGRPAFIPWRGLMQQFGGDDRHVAHLRHPLLQFALNFISGRHR